MEILTKSQLEELQKFDSPTISNAIESFEVRERTEGFMNYEIKCILSADKPIIGYANTARISAQKYNKDKYTDFSMAYYESVQKAPNPTIAVIQDMDPYPIGSYWGDVNAIIHQSLGCVGVVTSGGVRDIDETRKLNFAYFAKTVLVSHGYMHLVEYDCPVEVGGVRIMPGDLLFGDKHGVILIPREVAGRLAKACTETLVAEKPILEACARHIREGKEVDMADLKAWREDLFRKKAMIY